MTPARFGNLLKSMKQVTIIGYHGANNFGDDMMLKSIIAMLEEANVKINIVGFGEIGWIDPEIKVGKLLGRKFKKENLALFHEFSRDSDLVIWGGGTCFTDEEGDGFFNFMIRAKLQGKKIGYYSVGIGALNRLSRKLKTRTLINLSSYVGLRDDTSFEQARQYAFFNKKKVERMEDAANESILTSVKSHARHQANQDKKKNLLLAWRNLRAYSKDTTGENFEIIARYALELYREHGMEQITIMDTDSWQDNRVGMKFVEILNNLEPSIPVIHHTTKDYLEKYGLIAEAGLILTSRLHVAVCAHYLNIKCLAYNYSPKIQYFVEECGNPDIVLLEKDLQTRST